MSAIPGWYADPAGSDELRFFDGQQWAGTTSPRPVAPRAAPEAAGAPAVQRSAAPVASAPGSLTGVPGQAAPPVHRAPTGEPFYKKPKVLAGVAALVAVAVAGAVFVPGLLKHDPDSTVTPTSTSTAPVTTVKHLVLRTPTGVNGWPQATGPDAVKVLNSLSASLNQVTTKSVVAGYNSPTSDQGALVAVGQGDIAAGRRAGMVKKLLSGFAQEKVATAPAPTGPFGGTNVCGVTAEATPTAFCAFADDYAFGLVTRSVNRGTDANAEVLALRAQVEVLAAGPAPTSEAQPEATLARADARTIASSVASYYVDNKTGRLTLRANGLKWELLTAGGTTVGSGQLGIGHRIDASTSIKGPDDWCVAVINNSNQPWKVSTGEGQGAGRCRAA